jgi:hypothetical protein
MPLNQIQKGEYMKRVLAFGALMASATALQAVLLVDVGGQAAPVEPGWTAWITPGARLDNVPLSQSFTADFDSSFTVAIDNVDTRLRGAMDPAGTLTNMLRSAFKEADPIVFRFQDLAAGDYSLKMWHHDSNKNGKPSVDVSVTDALGINRLVADDLRQSWGPGPIFSTDDPTGPSSAAFSFFTFQSDGLNEVVVTVVDNNDVTTLYPTFAAGHLDWNEAFVTGFELAVVPEPSVLVLGLLGAGAFFRVVRGRKH